MQCGATHKWMVVEVTDTGVGIPEDKLQSIFEPFVQLERGQAPTMGGTGLGLAICKELVEQMGGTIGFSSVLHQGSVFYFTLPLHPDSKMGSNARWQIL